MKNKALLTTVALGAAYLMRNEKARNKLKNQVKEFASSISLK
ncbi:hypothetical protein [Bacillus sp. FJAT-50079]|nr:hypothetical protein [Bacillus sp. FJAT-50079]